MNCSAKAIVAAAASGAIIGALAAAVGIDRCFEAPRVGLPQRPSEEVLSEGARVSALIRDAAAAEREGRAPDATRLYRDLIAALPDDSVAKREVLVKGARASIARGRPEAAASFLSVPLQTDGQRLEKRAETARKRLEWPWKSHGLLLALGEANLAAGKPGEAAAAFAMISPSPPCEVFGRSPLYPAARLRLAEAFAGSGLEKSARLVLEELSRDFPGRPEAAEARRLLERLGQKEGP